MNAYLMESTVIDFSHPEIVTLAATLVDNNGSIEATAKNCFEWVRDNIRHSWDYRQNPVTWRASDVLQFKTGYCYAKSHLLGALLRANGIPAGFCYQRLSISGQGAPYCLHGLNAVFLPEHGWYRIDPRGNKEGVDAQFTPPLEKLAFPTGGRLEADLPEIWPQPLELVVSVLQRYTDIGDVFDHLPDVELLPVMKVM